MAVEIDWDSLHDSEKRQAAYDEAVRQGYRYVVYVDGDKKEGTSFVAPDDQDAIKTAHLIAFLASYHLDGFGLTIEYPTHAYRVYHDDDNRIVRDYIPPTPEEVTAGKAALWHQFLL